ncbi:MAG: hypothetical protein ACJA0X_002159 [Cyclobacteriaceae bacterium]|jgi:hypothetical protein
MTKISSKFSIAQTVLIPFYLFLATFGLFGLLMFAGSAALMKSDNAGYMLCTFSLVFLGMGILAVRHYMLLFNRITINKNGIEIKGLLKRATYNWSDVTNIHLTGKEFEKFMFVSMPMEAITIELKDDHHESVFVKLYSNMDRIRTVLHFIKIRLDQHEEVNDDCFTPVQREEPKVYDTSRLEKFGGRHLLTMNGIIAHGGWVFIAWFFLFSDSPMNLTAKLIFSVFILAFCTGLYGYQLHYFKLNSEFLVVKNHVWLWKNDRYNIADLREIVFEEPHKMSTSLRVVTNNYETKLYPAGSIRSKSWSRLSKEIEKLNIPVRNEAYFD